MDEEELWTQSVVSAVGHQPQRVIVEAAAGKREDEEKGGRGWKERKGRNKWTVNGDDPNRLWPGRGQAGTIDDPAVWLVGGYTGIHRDPYP